MSKVAATSGGLGDIIYSIPILRELKVKDIYIKESWYHYPHISIYSAIKSLLIHEGFNPLPTKGGFKVMEYEPGLKFDYDLDTFREMGNRGTVHIQDNMRLRFKLPKKKFQPWLSIPKGEIEEEYSIIHLTGRWRDGSTVDWKRVLSTIEGKVYFLGFQHEWVEFCHKYSNTTWLPTHDILDMGKLISGAKKIYCNQSVGLTLAQGLGKEYYLEQKPGKTNTLMRTKNEHLL